MIFQSVLNVGGEPKVSTEGAFIYVASADGLIEITTDTGRNYSLNRWDQVQVPEGESFREISIRNMHDAPNNVVIKTGYGKFFPANDGGSTFATVTQMPSVEIAGGQSVAVDNFPAVQQVSQSGAFTVGVDNFPAVQTVETKAGENYKASNKADFALTDFLIAEDLTRKKLIIKADPANVDLIWVGAGVDNGLPLFAGEKLEIETTASVNLHAVEITDNCYIAEVLA